MDVELIITPPTNETMTALWAQILGRPGTIGNATEALGLRFDVAYSNSTIRTVRCALRLQVPGRWQSVTDCMPSLYLRTVNECEIVRRFAKGA